MVELEKLRQEQELGSMRESQLEVSLEELVGGPVGSQQKVLELDKEKSGHTLRRKMCSVFLASTILAGAMTGIAKTAEAGEGFHFGRRLAESLQRAGDQCVNDAFQSSKDAEQRERNRADQMFNKQLDVIGQAVQLSNEQKRIEVQRINSQIEKYEGIKAEAIRNIGTPDSKEKIRLCDSEIAKLERKKESYLQNMTGIAPSSPPPSVPYPNPHPQPQFQPRPERSPAPPARGNFIREVPPPPEYNPQPSRQSVAPPRFESPRGTLSRSEVQSEVQRERMPTAIARVQTEDGRIREGPIPLPLEGQKFPPNVVAVEKKYSHLLYNSSWQPSQSRSVIPEPKKW